jgi:hypothetical protein
MQATIELMNAMPFYRAELINLIAPYKRDSAAFFGSI